MHEHTNIKCINAKLHHVKGIKKEVAYFSVVLKGSNPHLHYYVQSLLSRAYEIQRTTRATNATWPTDRIVRRFTDILHYC